MSATAVVVNGYLMVPEADVSLQDIIRLVDEHFSTIPTPLRYEVIVVKGPENRDQEGSLFVGQRETTFFPKSDPTQCRLPSYRSLGQIMESATSHPNCDFAKMKLVIPYGSPYALTLLANL
jgi:hypothetical protein